jgi:hypothetical protein
MIAGVQNYVDRKAKAALTPRVDAHDTAGPDHRESCTAAKSHGLESNQASKFSGLSRTIPRLCPAVATSGGGSSVIAANENSSAALPGLLAVTTNAGINLAAVLSRLIPSELLDGLTCLMATSSNAAVLRTAR